MATNVTMSSINLVSGALQELRAKGSADALTYGDSSDAMSLFLPRMQKIVPYAVAEQTICFNSAPSGAWPRGCYKAEISRTGPLLRKLYFSCVLSALPDPSLQDTNANILTTMWGPFYGAVENYKLNAGNVTVTEGCTEYLVCYNELYRSESEKERLEVADVGPYIRGCAIRNQTIRNDQDTIDAGIHYSTRAQEINMELPLPMSDHPSKALNLANSHRTKWELELTLRARDDVVYQFKQSHSTGKIITLNSVTLSSGQGEMSEAHLKGVYVFLDDLEHQMRMSVPSMMFYTYPQKQEIAIVSSDNNTRKEVRSYFNNQLKDIMFCYRSADKTATVGFKRWCEFGAYRASRQLMDTSGTIGSETVSGMYGQQEVINAIARFDVHVNNFPRIQTRTDYLHKTIPSARGVSKPKRQCYLYSFADDASIVDLLPGSMNASALDHLVFSFHMRTASAELAANAASDEHIGGLESHATYTEVTPAGNTAGTIFVFSHTGNFLYQENGNVRILNAGN